MTIVISTIIIVTTDKKKLILFIFRQSAKSTSHMLTFDEPIALWVRRDLP